MCVAYRRDASNANNVFVANIVLCKGVPFYGYHVGWSAFLKIYLLNPSYVAKCADLLRTGVVQGVALQPYEAHIPHVLQFLTDFNLYGCGWMRIRDARFRDPLPEEFAMVNNDGGRVSMDGRMLDGELFPRLSYSELEIDIRAGDIENRYELKEHNIHSHFDSEQSLDLPPGYKHLISMRELWREDFERRCGRGDGMYKEPVDVARDGETIDWSREKEMEGQLADRIRDIDMKIKRGEINPKLDSFVSRVKYDTVIPTAFEIVDVMFRRRKDDGESKQNGENKEQNGGDQINDENEEMVTDQDSDEDEDGVETTVSSGVQISLKRSAQGDSLTLSQKRRLTESSFFSYFSEDFDMAAKKSSILLLSQNDYPSVSSHGKSRLDNVVDKFDLNSSEGEVLGLRISPPSKSEVISSIEEFGIPSVIYKDPYFSKVEDVPSMSFTHAGVEFKLKSDDVSTLLDFQFYNIPFQSVQDRNIDMSLSASKLTLEYTHSPPSKQDVIDWLNNQPKQRSVAPLTNSSQINGPTQWNPYGYKFRSQKKKPQTTKQYSDRTMSVLAIEIHVNTRPGKLPNPKLDAVNMIFWNFQTDSFEEDLDVPNKNSASGILAFGDDILYKQLESIGEPKDLLVQVFDSELELIKTLIKVVQFYDPDVLSGYEVHNSSLGYIIDRGRELETGLDLCVELSRVRANTNIKFADRWGYTQASAFKVTGRHMLNIWRVIRHELNLLQYSIENVVFHTLHDRIPHYSHDDLTKWCQSRLIRYVELVVNYYMTRVNCDIAIINGQHLITRNSEQARLLGIDFYSVLSRGSQYKVESSLTRLAKKENFIMISPSKKQVGQQNALEHIPLVMEPLSGFYTSPVLVLDFQSLYPSIVIAYNYCYSTCLGRVKSWRGRNKLGVIDLDVDPTLLALLKDDLNIAPNGLIYVKEERRKSLLANMLTEILDTRVMIKAGMKTDKEVGFQSMMNNRQLALKLIANVTYGYTSATYSGRMPCAEIADSIVLTGREILEKTIQTITDTEKWGAQVVYGDTDSIFVHLPGKSKDQAFQIGNDIANTITSMNKAPIKLKFEKVYLSCVLLTKKRYVGYMYETPDQKVPVFDAKGIETVRRDGTPAEQKIEEKALRLLFETSDLSKIKEFLCDQWKKIMIGNVSIQDFCFAKEVRMGTYKEGGVLPPGAAVSAKKMEQDERAEPQYRQRVPYVVICGPPGSRLVDRCVSPEELVDNADCFLDADYYIKKNLIPPLERIFNILGANIRSWYDEMPKVIRYQPIDKGRGDTLRNYMKSASCVVCKVNQTNEGVCKDCRKRPAESMMTLQTVIKRKEKLVLELEAICRNCSAITPVMEVQCISGDCPIYYSRKRAKAKFKAMTFHEMNMLNLEW